MKSLKIALLTYSTKPRGGVVHTLSLAEELVRLGHRVHIYALGPKEVSSEFFRPVGVSYTIIPCPANPEETIDEKVERYIRVYSEFMSSIDENYDIYHAEDCISGNVLFELRSKGLIKFFIRTIHHIDDFTSKSLIECQLKSILEPDYVIVVSRFWEKELRTKYSLNPQVINNGVDLEKFKPDQRFSKEKAKRDYSVVGCKVMLSIGGIEPRKNTLTALRGFNIAGRYFKSKGERLVWLIGGGETLFDYRTYREEFFSEIKSLGLKLGEDIILLGTVPEESMPKLYKAGNVFVFPSIKEGWGLVVFEAMASGLPVVASSIEPMTDYLKDGENALLVSPIDYESLAQKIIGILENAELRDKLLRNATKTAQAYSWRNTALRHEEFYGGILGGVR
ncbi:MAG: MSMEG_0565 family glycosyltransferase [Candidatus Dadabacteria bacterium]|nr:MSMEG_0565 family glycosyltransferase [Candidatus Dadabacteria bacterium]